MPFKRKITFQDIPNLIELVLGKANLHDAQTIEEAEENIIKSQILAEEIIGKL